MVSDPAHEKMESLIGEETVMLIDNPQHTNFFATCLSLFGVVGFAGNFRQVNPAWKKVLGYSTSDIYKSLYLELVHPKDKSKTEAHLEQLTANRTFVNFTNRFRHNDGSYRDVLWEVTRSNTEPVYYVVGVDISIYNAEVQQAVQMAREDFEFIMENKREGVLDWNLHTNQVHYSPRWKHIVGCSENELNSQIETWYARIHPNDYTKVIKEVEACLKERTHPVYDKTHRLQHKDGSYRWVHSQGTVLRDSSGEGYRFLISFIDITERKRMEEALYTSEKFAKLFLCQADAVLLVNAQGRILDLNSAAAKLYGYLREELLNFNRAPMFTANEKFALSDNVAVQNGYHRRKDGTIFPVEVMIGSFEWQTKKLFILTVRDFTATKKVIETLADSEMKYRQWFEEQPDACLLIEHSSQQIVEANQVATSYYGYTKEEWSRLTLDKLVAESMDSLLATRQWEKIIQQGGYLDWHLKKEGTRFPVELNVSNYKFKNRLLWCVTIRDVTIRKQQEEQWYQAQMLSHKMVQTSPLPWLVFTPEGNILTANSALLQMTEYSLGEILQQDYFKLLVPRAELPFVTDAVKASINKSSVVMLESAIKPKTKPVVLIEWHFYALWQTTNQVESIVAIGINISERKQTYQQLRLFKKIVESSHEAMVVRKADGKLLYFNQAYEKLFKYTRSPLQMLATEDFARQCPIDTLQIFEQEITPLLQEGKTWEGVLAVLDAEGQPFYTWQRFDAIRDEHGSLLLFFVVMHNVTEQQALELWLQQERECYETIFQAAPLAITYTDTDNRLLKMNRYAAQSWNVTPEKLIGKSLAESASLRASPFFTEDLAVVSTGEAKLGRLHSYQGQHYHTSKVPYEDAEGQIVGVITFALDITSHIQQQITWRDKSMQYETLLQAAPLAIMYKDVHNRFVFVNQYASQRWNVTPDKLIGMSFFELDPDYAEKYHLDDFEIIKTGEPKFGLLAEYAEGFYWQMDKVPYRDASGNISGLIIFAVEMTERTRLERQLRHQRQQYETIFHAAPFAIWYKDWNDKLVLVNQLVAKLWDTYPEKLVGMSFHDLEPEYANLYQATDYQVMTSGKPALGIIEEYFQVDWLMYKIPYRNETDYVCGLIVFAVDLTEQLQTEAALRQELQATQRREASLRCGIQSLPMMVYALNNEGNIALWNQKCEQVTGYKATEMVDNSRAWELLYPNTNYREQMGSSALELLKHNENWQQWQWTLNCKSGGQKTIAWSMNQTLLENKSGLSAESDNHSMVVGRHSESSSTLEDCSQIADLEWVIGEDVTEHEQTLQDLLASERRLQQTLENLPMMVEALDEEGNIVVWNHECERVTGYAKVDIVGNSRAWELLYPEPGYREQLFQTQRDMLAHYGEIRQWELSLTCKQGEQRNIAWSVSKEVKMSGFSLWFIGQDVTDQERVMERLCDSEERLWLLIQHMPVMLKAYDESGKVILWNRHCEEVTGYAATEIADCQQEQEKLSLPAEMSESAITGEMENPWRRETAIICKDGTHKLIVWSDVSKQFPIPGWYRWLIGEDITAFKQMAN